MRIGIVPAGGAHRGGMHQYTLNILQALAELARDGEHECLFFEARGSEALPADWNGVPWTRVRLQPFSLREQAVQKLRSWLGGGRIGRMSRVIRRRISSPRNLDEIRHRPKLARLFQVHGVDWLFFTAPSVLSLEAGLPFVMPVHDLQHRLQPEFPEVSENGEWEWREYLYRNAARYATFILVDSEVGREDVLRFYAEYGASPDRIKILPLAPAGYLSPEVPEGERMRVRRAYNLPVHYLFYPAQFWPHKNHIRIVEALGLLKGNTTDEIHVAFCGSFSGEIRRKAFEEVAALGRHLGVSRQIHYLGYVPNQDMSGLYAGARGLVMPTFFGPTNTPVPEAWAFGCPVLTSDIRGIREQVGDAGLLVDPRSAEAIASGMQRLWEETQLRQELAARGRRRLAGCTWKAFRDEISTIVQEVAAQWPRVARPPRLQPGATV